MREVLSFFSKSRLPILIARTAKTAGRARFMQMAREYQSAAALIHTELSADLRSGSADRLGRGAEQHSAAS